MRQVRLLPLACAFLLANSLFAEEARRAELVNPPKKSVAEEPARALPVTAADKKEVVASAKKDRPSVEIDLSAKKEPAPSSKKEISASDKKEGSSAAKKDVAQVEKKPINPADKKELSAPAKKEVVVAAKKDVGPSVKKDVAAIDKKDVSPVAKKEVSQVEKKEVAATDKKEVSAPTKKVAVAAVVKKEVSQTATKEIAVVDKKEVSSKAKQEFTFKDEKGKTVSAEVVDQYQSKRIVYPLAKIDHRVNAKLVHAASIAQDRSRAHSKSACWHYVKNALLASGIISSYPKSVYAKQAGDELVRDYGFKKLPIRDPYQAPIGAVLVYGSRRAAGHVELRTKTGFVSDFQNKKPSRRPLLGVYAKA